MNRTTQDWRAGIARTDWGDLCAPPRLAAFTFTRGDILALTRPLADAVEIDEDADQGLVIVRMRMDTEENAMGVDRATRLFWARSDLGCLCPAVIHVVVVDDVGEEPLRCCCTCGAVMADDFGDVPNVGRCQGCAWERHCAGYAHQEMVANVMEMVQDAVAKAGGWMVSSEARPFTYQVQLPPIPDRIVIDMVVGVTPEDLDKHYADDLASGDDNPKENPTDGYDDGQPDPDR